LAEFDVFQTTENFANACHPNLIDIDPDSVLQEFQLVEPQIFQNDDQDQPSDEEIQFFNYIMNSNVPDNALDHIMDEPMVQPVDTQSQAVPVSATPDPIYNFIYETTSPVSLEETTPAPVVSSPASYTESSETNVTVVVPVGSTPLINLTFDPLTGSLEEATNYGVDGVPSPSSSIDSDQISMTSSPGRPKIDNKERCKQYRQRTKNARKSAEDEVEKEKLRNIELTIKAERMEKQKKKLEKMILHFTKLNGKNHEKKNLANQIKLAIGFLDI